jgi:hypothetical protein
MHYFKITDATGMITEYCRVADPSEIKPKVDGVSIEEISESDFNLLTRDLRLNNNLFMPTF